MNKMKKLLSVVLAVVLAFSALSVLGVAAKTSYKTVAELDELGAYSPYGQVSRLSTEARMSIVADELDVLLASLNINMGTVLDTLGITIVLDLTSIDRLCYSLDTFKTAKGKALYSIAAGILNLGVVEDLKLDSWLSGMTRDGTAQLTIAFELFELLATNQSLVEGVLTDGIELGIIANFIDGLDLSDINAMVTDLPSLVKGMLFPMFERWDQTLAECELLESALTGDGKVLSTLDWVVNNYFTRPMSLQTVKADASGNITSDHTLPSGQTHRRQFVQNGTTITVYQYYGQSAVDKDETGKLTVGYNNVGDYVLEREYDHESAPYVFVHTDEFGNKTTLKHYADGTEWLPEFVADGQEFHVTSETGMELLYKMIPYVFEELAPVVLNGSMKKILSGLFGVTYDFVGNIATDGTPDDAVAALPGYDASLEVFGPEGDYTWEWTAFDYIVVDSVDYFYYRYEGKVYKANLSNANEYIKVFNWDWKITGDFMDEFVPASVGGTNAGGYDRLLESLNDFLVKVANLVFNYTELGITAPENGDNSKLIPNIQKVAQAFVDYAPWNIFGYEGDDKEDRSAYDAYYQLFMDLDANMVLTGIAAFAIDALAPQMHLPTAESIKSQNLKVGALLAAMLRELATQMLPSVNYDALIYTDYNSGTFVAGKDNSYWLDVILTMGVDIGFKYLRNLADLDEDKAAWTALGYSQSKTYTLAEFEANPQAWEKYVDYIIDWALTVDGSGDTCVWNMANMVNTDGLTIDMATAQDPWAKLDKIFDDLLFLDQFTSETDLETGLRGTILDLVDLNWGNIFGTPSNAGLIDIPASSKLVTDPLLNAVTLEIRDLLNGIFNEIGGGYTLIPTSITNLDEFATHANLKTIAGELVGHLDDFYNNGLLTVGLPFINFFLGWKVDPQVYAEPEITLTNANWFAYMYTDSSTVSSTINLRNASSGMLERHRGTDVADHPYDLKVTSVTLDNGTTVTATGLDTAISPGTTGTVGISFPYTAETGVTLDIAYEFVGKDGQPIGGTQHKYVNQWVSNSWPNEVDVGGGDAYEAKPSCGSGKNRVVLSDFNTYIFSNDPAAVENFYYKWTKDDDHKNTWVKSFTSNTAPVSPFAFVSTSTFVHGDSENSSIRPNGVMKNTGSEDTDISTEWAFYAYELTNENFEFVEGSTYKLGNWTMRWRDGDGLEPYLTVDGPTFCYYDIVSLEELWNSVYDVIRTDYPAATDAEWNAFVAARHAASEKVIGPRVIATFATDYSASAVDTVETNLQTAYDALIASLTEDTGASAEGADISALEEALALDTSLNADGKEINFQDYELYEYWAYEDYRTSTRNLLKGMTAPEVMDQYYIEGSGISEAELNKVIAAATNSFVAAGITASRSENDATAIAESQAAHDNFVAPVYTELYIDDQASRLNYYRGFLPAKAVASDLAFITKELAYADANYPVNDTTKALYTEGSWNEYVEAYNAADAITAADRPSQVFAAKYDLMVKMKNLLLKEDSLLLNGGADELKANKDIADAIFASLEAGDGTWTLKEGVDANTAYAALISALGYYYTGEDGNTWNLYADSALEYLDNDRPNRSTNQRRVNAANSELETAIAMFTLAEAPSEPNTIMLNPNAPFEAVIDTVNTNYGEFTGTIYGFDTLGANDSYAVDGTIAEFLTTAYGDEYLEVVVGDSGAETTGAVINVLDADGAVVESYVYIYFGDIDMDGWAGASDAFICENFEITYTGFDTVYQFMAGDVDGDGWVGAADAFPMENYEVNGAGMVYQSEVAQSVVNNEYAF